MRDDSISKSKAKKYFKVVASRGIVRELVGYHIYSLAFAGDAPASIFHSYVCITIIKCYVGKFDFSYSFCG